MENIEFSSKKAQRVVGDIPPSLVRIGTSVLSLISICLAISIYNIHYPITIDAEGKAVNDSTIVVDIPYKYIRLFEVQRAANVIMEGGDSNQRFVIEHYEHTLKTTDRGNVFTAYIAVKNKVYRVQPGQKALVSVIVSDRSLFDLIFSKEY